VQEMGERRLLHDLSQELEKRHRLVQEQEEVPVGRRRLSRYRFAHTLFQQYVYNGLGDGERRLLHIEIGEVLGALYGDQADEIAVQLAHHFTEGESWEQAVHYQTRAGRQALDLFETDIARRYLEMAERIAESQLGGQVDVQDKLACLEGLGDIYRTLGDYDEAMRCYEGALDLVAEDSCQTARICWKLAIVFERQSRYDDALPWLDLGLEALADTDNADLLSRLYLQYGLISARQGDLGKAFEWANKALVSESSQAHNLLAVVHRARGDLQQAASHLEKSIALGEANRDLTNLLKAYSNQGVLLFAMDNWTAAGYAYERATKLSADLDDAYMEALIQCNLSDVRRHLGDLAEATRYAAESLQKFEELENNFGKAQAHLNWGAALLMAGQPKEARTEHLELARKLLISTDSKELLSEVERWLAEAYLREGQLVKAESAARQAMAIANDQEALSDLGGAQRVLGCVHQAKGEYQRSRQLLESSQELLGQHGPRYELALTQLALAKVYQADPRCTPEAAHTLERARAAFLELGARLDMEKASALDLSLEKPSTGESGA
jgi:adenylate cyclase